MLREVRLLSALFIALSLVASCTKASAPANPDDDGRPPPAAHVAGEKYAVSIYTPACTGDPCALELVILAKGDTHVNAEYPHRFTPDPASTVVFTETRAFRIVDETTGVLTAHYVAPDAVDARLTGQLALSVCSDAQCTIEKVRVDVPVPR